MKEFEKNSENGSYDTAINIIGSLKDISMIFNAFNAYFSSTDSYNDLINKRNEFNLRTEKSRDRIEHEVNKVFLRFKNEEHESLIQSIFQEEVPLKDRKISLLWQFALNNRLLREITINVFMKYYFEGKVNLSKEDVIAYLKDLTCNDSQLINWSESTINIIASKYLKLMSNLGFLSSERIKSFNLFNPSSESIVLFLYFAKLYSPDSNNILKNDLLPISFISSVDLYDRLKKLSIKGFFNLSYNGVSLNIDLIHSYRSICDELYKRQ